jgi:hypothetical protein
MALSNENWSQLGARLDALALKLRMHLEQAGTDELPKSLTALRGAIVDAFEAAGSAVRDDAVRADLKEAGSLLANAVSTTFAIATEQVRERVSRRD